jgi:putative SOS response-associated peptidase YedK
MCGPYASFLPAEAIARIFGIVNLRCRTWWPSWNVTPTNDCAIVRRHPQTGQRHLVLLTWGRLPYWTKEPAKARRSINACPETEAKPVGQDVTARVADYHGMTASASSNGFCP